MDWIILALKAGVQLGLGVVALLIAVTVGGLMVVGALRWIRLLVELF